MKIDINLRFGKPRIFQRGRRFCLFRWHDDVEHKSKSLLFFFCLPKTRMRSLPNYGQCLRFPHFKNHSQSKRQSFFCNTQHFLSVIIDKKCCSCKLQYESAFNLMCFLLSFSCLKCGFNSR